MALISSETWGGTKTAGILALGLILSACQTTEPGIEVRTVEVVKEVQKPCPGTPPVRPNPIGQLMATTDAALAQVLAKLAEYSAPGQYADQSDAYVAACPPGE